MLDTSLLSPAQLAESLNVVLQATSTTTLNRGQVDFDNVRLTVIAGPGDANFDGFVDGADYTMWADHYLSTVQNWTSGDFTGDGLVNGADYTIWADNYAPAAMASAIPEPSALALAGIGALALLAVRTRRLLKPRS